MIEIKLKKQNTPIKGTETAQESIVDERPAIPLEESKSPSEGEYRPSTGIPKMSGYSDLYRRAYEFHAAHTPPMIDRAYWETHTPGEDDMPQAEAEYWEQFGRDTKEACKALDGNPFFIGLIVTIGKELTREYKAARQAVKDNSA